jgi:hypothetical protein
MGHYCSPEKIDAVRVVLQRSPSESTRDIQMISATYIEKWFEFVSIQNDIVA